MKIGKKSLTTILIFYGILILHHKCFVFKSFPSISFLNENLQKCEIYILEFFYYYQEEKKLRVLSNTFKRELLRERVI